MLPPVTVTASGDVAPVEQVSFELAPVLSEPVPMSLLPSSCGLRACARCTCGYEPAPVEPVAYELRPSRLRPTSLRLSSPSPTSLRPLRLRPTSLRSLEPWPTSLRRPSRHPPSSCLPPSPSPSRTPSRGSPSPSYRAAPRGARPVAVHPPVPAAELPALVEPSREVPFWKKDLSLSRKEAQGRKGAEGREGREGQGRVADRSGRSRSRSGRKAAVPETATHRTLPAVAATPLLEAQAGHAEARAVAPFRGGEAGRQRRRTRRPQDRRVAACCRPHFEQRRPPSCCRLHASRLRTGVVVGGELREPDALAAALKVFFAKNKLPRKNVRLGIASNRIGVRILDIVGIDEEKQLANAVQFRAQEALPIPLDEAVLDYRRARRVGRRRGQSVKRVLLVVAYRDLVDRYVSACRKAGIALAGIDLEAFALLRALAAPADRGALPRSSPSRSATTVRRSPSPTAASASSRAFSSGAAGR